MLLLGPLLPLLLATTTQDALGRAIWAQREIVAERPADASARSDLGNLLALAGDTYGAEQAYLEAVELDPMLFDAFYNFGLLLLGEERYDDAVSRLRTAANLDPGSAWARYHLGTSQRGRGRRSDAIQAYAEAFRLDPRLAFADINPDILQNPFLTESLLLAHRDRPARAGRASAVASPPSVSQERPAREPRSTGPRSSAPVTLSEPVRVAASPRAYAEPERIAELLVPHSASGESHSLGERSSARDSARDAVEPVEPVSPRSFDDGDVELVPPEIEDEPPQGDPRIRRGPTPPRSQAGAFVVPSAPAPADNRRSLGPGDLSGGGRVDEGGGGGSDDEPAPTSPVTRFRPGRRSSAQLDLLLLPRGGDGGERPDGSERVPIQTAAAGR